MSLGYLSYFRIPHSSLCWSFIKTTVICIPSCVIAWRKVLISQILHFCNVFALPTFPYLFFTEPTYLTSLPFPPLNLTFPFFVPHKFQIPRFFFLNTYILIQKASSPLYVWCEHEAHIGFILPFTIYNLNFCKSGYVHFSFICFLILGKSCELKQHIQTVSSWSLEYIRTCFKNTCF